MPGEFRGIVPALVTPFDREEEVDLEALRRIIARLLAAGVHGLFVTGSQGEFYALDASERQAVWGTAVAAADGRVPVYAGVGAFTTREAVRQARQAEACGVSAVSILPPFYIKPSEDELYIHFRTVAEATELPVLLYNNPDRTGVHLTPRLIRELASEGHIVGIKDSSGDLSLLAAFIEAGGSGFAAFVGRDSLIFPALLLGAQGAVAATGNVIPEVLVALYESVRRGDLDEARRRQRQAARLRSLFSLGTFPAMIKEALNLIGEPVGPARAPVASLTNGARDELRAVLVDLGLI